MYVIDSQGRRIMCPHPGEDQKVSYVLGKNASSRLIRARTGFNSDCVCLECLAQFKLDIGNEEFSKFSWRYYYGAIKKRDKRKCPSCDSTKVRTVPEMVDQECPKCKIGHIREIWTGTIC